MFYLPGECTHTDTEGKQREARVRNILKSSGKNTIFNEHPVFRNANHDARVTAQNVDLRTWAQMRGGGAGIFIIGRMR